MQFLIYKDAGEARLSRKMQQIWTPRIFNHFHGSCGGWLSSLQDTHPPHAQAAFPSLGDVGGFYPRSGQGQK